MQKSVFRAYITLRNGYTGNAVNITRAPKSHISERVTVSVSGGRGGGLLFEKYIVIS